MRKALMISALCAGCALAQTPLPPKQVPVQIGDVAGFGPVQMAAPLMFAGGTIAGAPYSADAITERVQTLADGNRIEQTTTGSVARDSQGRVRRDEPLVGLTVNNGETPHIVMIEDPVAQVHWRLDVQNKVAMKLPVPPAPGKNATFSFADAPPLPPSPASGAKTWFYSTGSVASGPNQVVVRSGSIGANAPANDPNVTQTDLGSQTIEGVVAQGHRVTRTIPAGQIGNQQPIVITTETWYSPDLHVLVMSTSSDPRMGETTYKLTNIQRSEPAASLFQVPDDYTIKEPQVHVMTSTNQ